MAAKAGSDSVVALTEDDAGATLGGLSVNYACNSYLQRTSSPGKNGDTAIHGRERGQRWNAVRRFALEAATRGWLLCVLGFSLAAAPPLERNESARDVPSVLADLRETNRVLAVVNWPFHTSEMDYTSGLYSPTNWFIQRQAYQCLGADEVLRFLRDGTAVPPGAREPPEEPEVATCGGLVFSRQGEWLFWHLRNVGRLRVWNNRQGYSWDYRTLVLDKPSRIEKAKPINEVLVPPAADEVAWCAPCFRYYNLLFGSLLPMSAERQQQIQEFVQMKKRVQEFLRTGAVRSPQSVRRPQWVLWDRAGAFVLRSGRVFFFDLWRDRRMYLEAENGAGCVLDLPGVEKDPGKMELAEEGRLGLVGGGAPGETTTNTTWRVSEQGFKYAGREYLLWVSADELQRAPAFDIEREPPPLQVNQAVRLSRETVCRLFPEGRWKLGGLGMGGMSGVAGRWYYSVQFTDLQEDTAQRYFSVFVLMDGTVLVPKELKDPTSLREREDLKR